VSEPLGEVVVACRGVQKRFGSVEILRGLDLEVRRGEIVAVTGPSGGGKSTLLHLLGRLDRATAGEIVVDGQDLDALVAVNRYRRHVVGIVFQLHNLLPHLSAARNVELAMYGTGRGRRERVDRVAELLEQLDLGHAADRVPPKLSGGERQRVAIARAIANSPRVLLADEPTGSLDPASSALVIDLLRDLRDTHGTSVVAVTHDPEVAAAADRRVVLRDGAIHDAEQATGPTG
jgi:ABC-type lipoprotein export system ATPase subunit